VTTHSSDKWARASLRVASARLSLEDITAALETPPTRGVRAGSPIGRLDPTHVRQESIWLLETSLGEGVSLDAHLEELTSFAEAHVQQMVQLRPSCDLDMRCAFASESGQGGFVISSNLLRRLGQLELELWIDLFPPELSPTR